MGYFCLVSKIRDYVKVVGSLFDSSPAITPVHYSGKQLRWNSLGYLIA